MITNQIAVVDDEPEIANAIAQLLTPTGLSVEVFNSAAQFLARLETTTFRCRKWTAYVSYADYAAP
jgi:FixJ family two-component response regulator